MNVSPQRKEAVVFDRLRGHIHHWNLLTSSKCRLYKQETGSRLMALEGIGNTNFVDLVAEESAACFLSLYFYACTYIMYVCM
jgi:hypothetical protein